MTTTVLNQNDVRVSVPTNHQLTVVLPASSTGLAQRYVGETLVDTVPLSASTTTVFGEYEQDMVVRLNCFTGSLTYNDTVDAVASDSHEVRTTTVAVGSPISETTNTPVDMCSMTLPAGDWDVSGVMDRVLTGVTATRYGAAISPTSNTIPTQPGGSGIGPDSSIIQNAVFGATVTGNYATVVGPVRVSLTAPATIYFVGNDLFSAGTLGLYGTLRARRAR